MLAPNNMLLTKQIGGSYLMKSNDFFCISM